MVLKKGKTKHSFLFYIAWSLAIIAVVLILWTKFGIWHAEKFNNKNDAGIYGDSYGYVNSLFSGLAAGGVVFAIILQTLELGLQRRELEENREELRRSAVAQENLVQINALTVMMRNFVDSYVSSKEKSDRDYLVRLRKKLPSIVGTLRYKMNRCGFLIERKYAEIAQTEIGLVIEPDLEAERRGDWISRFLSIIPSFDPMLEEVSQTGWGAPSTYYRVKSYIADLIDLVIDLSEYVEVICKEVEEVDKFLLNIKDRLVALKYAIQRHYLVANNESLELVDIKRAIAEFHTRIELLA